MTDHELEMLGRIDERTENIQKDIAGIKEAVSDQYTKINAMRSELDTLLQAHKDRTASPDNGCTVVNMPSNNPILPKWAVGVIGGSGAVGIALFIVLIILLRKYGYI